MTIDQHEVPPASDDRLVKAITEMNNVCVPLGTMDILKCLSTLVANVLVHYPEKERLNIMMKFNSATLGIADDMEKVAATLSIRSTH